MTYRERIELFKEIEEKRNRPVIAYVTSSRHNASAQMASDVIPEFTKQINNIPEDDETIDLFVVSRGGDAIVPWRIMSILRERFKKVGIILPYEAYSAATLLALGADEIVMHPFANLGPVDPQLTFIRTLPGNPPQKEEISFGFEDLRHYLDFIRSDVQISDQEQMEKAFEFVCKGVGAISIGIAKKSSYLALSMGEKLLELHMDDHNKAKTIAEALNTSFYHHGYPLGRDEAKEIGLPITNPDREVEKIIWKIWENYIEEMKINTPFEPLEVVLKHPGSAPLTEPVPNIQIPSNMPPQMAQKAYQQILQQSVTIRDIPLVDYELFLAAVESKNCRSIFNTKGKIAAIRYPDSNIAVNVMKTSEKWNFEKSNNEE